MMLLSDRLRAMTRKATELESRMQCIQVDLDILTCKGKTEDDVYTAQVQFIEVIIKIEREFVIKCLKMELESLTVKLEKLSQRVTD